MADRLNRVGLQLGNYRLIRILGAGGFAEVYLAEHIHLGTKAAVKVLHAQLTHDNVEAFRTEARTIAHLVHPHIVRVLDFGIEGTTPFLVMDYAPNGTLRNRHPKGSSLAITTIVTYIKQVADALQYAHNERLIHRDMKPENMLVGRSNEVFLSDFGIALIAQSSRHQSTQEVMGTVTYMSPEHIQGKPRPASDQYSLGIVVYEWLTGDRPFHGSFIEVCTQHMFAPPPSLREKLPTLSPDLEQVVMIALAKDPKQRFASVRAFATALEQASQLGQNQLSLSPRRNILPSQPLSPAIPVTLLNQSSKLISDGLPANHSLVLEQASQPSVPLPVTTPPNQPLPPTILAILPNPSPEPTTDVPPLRHVSHASGVSGTQRPISQLTRYPSRRMVIVGLIGLTLLGDGVTWFTTSHGSISQQVSSPTPTPTVLPLGTTVYTYHGHSGGLFSAIWSPDGKRIASGSYNDRMPHVWDAANGSNLLTYRGHSDPVWPVVWSPDGKHIASGSTDKTVQVWDAANGSHVFTYHGHSDSIHAVKWSPDGKRIASGSYDRTVQVWEVIDGNNLFTSHGYDNWVLSVAWSPDGKRIASGSADQTVQIWDAVDGSNLFVYHGHSYYVRSVVWSPNGKHIASGSGDKTVQVWNATNGSNLLAYRGHSDSVRAVAWSPDGKHIASGSADHTVQIWNAANGNNVFTYHGHSDSVDSVAWSPDGKYIASGSWDRTVQVWVAS